MNWLPLNVIVKGWSSFLEEEVGIISAWIFFTSILYFFLDALTYTSIFLIFDLVIIFRKIVAGGFCCSSKKLHGQTIIITGSNTGIGKETARDLANRGATIILACRDMKKAERAAMELKFESGSEVVAEKLDLASFKSIRSFASNISIKYNQVHCLINNAGIMMCPYMETEDGLEMQMGVNHFGHFLLTALLLPLLNKGHNARIINLSSMAHLTGGYIPFDDFNYKKKGYNSMKAYSNSKVANILHARHLAKILEGSNVQVFAVHPGLVESKLGRHMFFPLSFIYSKLMSFVAKTTKEGAQTSIHCATDATQQSSFYFSDCLPDRPSTYSLSDETAEQLWIASEKITNISIKDILD